MRAPPPTLALSTAETKAYKHGTHRAVAPSKTLAALQPMLSRFGITRVANVTGLDRIGIPVVMVVRPNSRSVSVSQGKGLDMASAKVSGLMESIESWHAERIMHPLILASIAEMGDTHPVARIEQLPQVDGSPLTETRPILWIEGEDLAGSTPTWLPYEMVHTNYTLPRPAGEGCFSASTNGLASGNTVTEATVHAICEVIERDALTLWHHATLRQKAAMRINLSTVDDPDCRGLLQIFEEKNLDCAVWDITSDTGIASFHCLLLDSGPDRAHLGAGTGCHLSSAVALSRALTEAVQTRTTYIAGSRDDLHPAEFTAAGRDEKYAFAERVVAGHEIARDYRMAPDTSASRFDDDLAKLLGNLHACGIEQVLRVDLTRRDIGVPVVRVVIPGLEAPHDDDTYVAGYRAQRVIQDQGSA
ncbi:MAG: YcaO-like family protein [Pseudomonadota bacterium]